MLHSVTLLHVRGIPIRAHPTLLILLPVFLFHIPFAQWAWSLAAMAGLLASVALHELGHSLAALRRGYRVLDITLLPIGGLARMDRSPVRPGDEFSIALAGPGVSLGLAVLFRMAAGPLRAGPAPVTGQVATLLAGANLILALFNLLPSFPMDGGRVFRAWLTPFLGRKEATRRAARLGRTLAVMFGIWSLFIRFNMIHLAIAVFVYLAAGAEYQAVARQEQRPPRYQDPMENPPRVLTETDAGVYVSPPPYGRVERKKSQGVWDWIRSLFDNLVEHK